MDFLKSQAVWNALMQDVHLLDKMMKSSQPCEEQFWRRMLCRSIFGMVEAWLSFIRGDYLPLRYSAGVFPSEPEKAELFKSLFEATDAHEWILDERGKSEKKNRKISFRPFMKACIRMMYMLHGKTEADADELFASNRWGTLVRSVRLRDGLMHPHTLEDIYISDEATSELGIAIELVIEMLNFTTDHVVSETERMLREAERLHKQAADSLARAAKMRKRSEMYQRLRQEILEHKPYIHAIVIQEGETAIGKLIKVHPSAEAKAVTQTIQVIVSQGPDKTCFILRTPDAPRLEEP